MQPNIIKPMKTRHKTIPTLAAALVLAACAATARAAVPLRWQVETSRVNPVQFDAYHGETLHLEAALQSYGKPLAITNEATVCWHTNGMDSAYWTAPASVSNNVVSADFTPAMDPGAAVVNGFIGVPGENWRAAFQLRFRPSPGADPHALPLPVQTIDFSRVEVSNAPYYDKAETEAKIAELAPQPDFSGVKAVYSDNGTYRLRQNGATEAFGYDIATPIVNFTNSVGEIMLVGNGAGKWYHRDAALGLLHFSRIDGWIVCDEYSAIRSVEDYPGDPILSFAILNGAVYAAPEGLQLGWHEISRLADESGVPATVSNIVTEAYVESLGISSEETDPHIGLTNGTLYVKGQTIKPLTSHQSLAGYVPNSRTVNSKPLSSNVSLDASDVGAYPATDGEALAGQVSAIGATLHAEDAHFVSTNYDSNVRLPEAYVEVKMRDETTGSNTWITIWQEMRRWTAFVGSAFDWSAWSGFHAWATNITHELSFKADRCWGIYDSETGGYSPEGYTQISSSNILIAAGMAYQRTVTSGGAVWVLQCNQGTAHVGGDTNGFFRVVDGDGVTQFEIIKGDKREMGADASGITVGSGTPPVVTIPYSVEADEHPTLQVCDNLTTANWKAETDSDCLATVSWSGVSGAYVATVQRKTIGNAIFVKASYLAGGETYIHNVAPVGMNSLILGGTRYYLGTATINGHTVLTLSTTAP